MMGIIWPDGRPLLEQPQKLIEAFNLIGEVEAECKKGKDQ